jgi:hypothetical protein
MTIVYSCDKHGNITRTVKDRKLIRSNEIDHSKPFEERMLRNYYQLECEQALIPGTDKNKIKRTWELDGLRRQARVGEHASGD